MSSFTDKLLTFNPYISQVPVDSYLQVGIYKQQQYEQGLQKVQGFIDSIRGIDVVKDEHKQYIDKTLQNLQGESRKIVSADFSNSQIVNQMGALTSKIVADPIIQNAIVSTQRYKKGLTEMQKAQAEGKSGVENDYDFQDQANKWLSDKDIKSSFSGSYTPYRDVRKKVMEAIKAVDPSSKITQIPFMRNSDGSTMVDEKGRPKVDEVMMELDSKGKSYDAIRNAVELSLDESDVNQLNIEGKYHFRNYDPPAMKKVVDENYKSRVGDLNKMLNNLQTQKMSDLSNKAFQSHVDSQIKSIKDAGTNINKNYAQDIDNLSANSTAFKAKFYLDNYLDQVGKAFSSTNESFKYLDNPYQKRIQEERDYNLRYNKFLHDVNMDKANYELRVRELQMKEKKSKMEGTGLIPTDAPVILPTLNDIQKPVEADWKTSIQQTEAGIIANKGEVMKQLWNNLPPAEAEKELLKLKDSWEQGKNVDVRAKEYFSNTEAANRDIENKKQALLNIQAEANKNSALDVNKITGGFRLQMGNTVYDAAEMVGFTNKMKQIFSNNSVSVGGIGVSTPSFDESIANQILTPKEKILYSIYKKNYNGLTLSKGEQTVMDAIEKTNKTIAPIAQKAVEQRNDFFSTKIAALTKNEQPEAYIIDAGKPEKLYAAKGLVNSFLMGAKDRKGGVGESPNFDYEDAVKANNDEKSTYGIYKQGDKAFLTVMSGKTPAQYIPITISQLNANFGGAFNRPFDPIQRTIAMSGDRRSTNVRGKGEETAYFSRSSFPYVTQYGLKADVEQTTGGAYQIKLYIYDPTKKTWITRTSPTPYYDESDVLDKLGNIGDLTVKQLLEESK